MARKSIPLEVGDLVQLKNAHRHQKFRMLWDKIGIIINIGELGKGKNMGKSVADVSFIGAKRTSHKILLERLRRVG